MSEMEGRKVLARGAAGVVVKWAPLQSSMCDALVRFEDGHECWFASHELRPNDGQGPLPCRREARELAEAVSLRQLREIRAQHVRDFNKPWPGMNFGKAHFGMMLDSAIADLEEKP